MTPISAGTAHRIMRILNLNFVFFDENFGKHDGMNLSKIWLKALGVIRSRPDRTDGIPASGPGFRRFSAFPSNHFVVFGIRERHGGI